MVFETLLGLAESIPGEAAFALAILVLLFCGVGIPLAEEVPILVAAYLTYEGYVSIPVCIVSCYFAALGGDAMTFFIGRHFGIRIFEIRPFRRLATRRRLKRANLYFKRWGSGVVFLGRFLPGARTTIFVTAAILRMPFRRFMAFDGSAALISIPLNVIVMVSLIQLFDEDFESVREVTREMSHSLAIAAILILLILAGYVFYRRRKSGRLRFAIREKLRSRH